MEPSGTHSKKMGDVDDDADDNFDDDSDDDIF